MTPSSRGTRTGKILGFITRQIVSIARAWTQEGRVIFIALKNVTVYIYARNGIKRLQGSTLEDRNLFQGASLQSKPNKHSSYNRLARVVAFVFVKPFNKLKLSVSTRTLAIFAVVLVLAPVGALSLGLLNNRDTQAAVGINDEINFQARLLTAGGGLVADGNYNVEFRIYQDGDGDLGGGDETLQWTEAHLNDNSQGIQIKNGYLSARLGSITSLSAVDFNQDTLWLSINIGDTTTCTPFSNCSGDGEMDPFMRFTSTPYALNSDEIDGLDSTDLVQLGQNATPQAVNTANSAIAVNQTGSGNLIQLQDGGTDRFVIADGGAATLTGTLTVSSTGVFQGSSVTVGTTSQQGDLILNDGSSNTVTIRPGAHGQNTVLTIPDAGGATDTLCLQTLDNCGGGSVTLQEAYNNGNTITTTDARDIDITLDDTATDSDFTIDIATGSTSKFAVQYGGSDVFSVTGTNGNAAFQNATDSTTGFQILDSDGGTSIFNVDTTNERIGIGTDAPGYQLHVVDTSTSTTGAAERQVQIDFTDTGIVTTGTDDTFGLDVNVVRTGATGGTINSYGGQFSVFGDTGGTSEATGISGVAASADTNVGVSGLAILQDGDALTTNIGVAGVASTWTGVTSGTLTTAVGLQGFVDLSVGSGATVTNGYGLRIQSADDGSNTLTNNYGIFVDDQTEGSTADYGIAIAGADTYALWVGSGADNTDAANGITFGSSGDTNLYRSDTDELTTDDSLVVANQFDAGGNVFTVNSVGSLGITLNPGEDNARIAIDTAADTNRGIIVRGNSASQSVNLTEWQDSDGDVLTSISPTGVLGFADGAGGAEDTNLYRSGANTLQTDDSLVVSQNLTVNGSLVSIDNNADSSLNVILDSGSTATQATNLNFYDQGTGVWSIQKSNTNSFLIYDNDDTLTRLNFVDDGDSVFNLGSDTSDYLFRNSSQEEILTVTFDGDLIFEGDNADAHETTLEVVEPTADVTFQLETAAAGTYQICTTASVCAGYGAANPTLQDAYDQGNNITTTDARDIEFDLADTATDASFVVDLQGTGNTFEIQDGGTSVFAVVDGGGVTFQNTTDSTTGFQILDSDGGTSIFNVDTTNERVGIGTDAPSYKLEVVDSSTSTTAAAEQGAQISFTDTGVVTTGTDNTYGLAVDTVRTGATGGTINSYGIQGSAIGDTGGTSTAFGVSGTANGADSSIGVSGYTFITDGQTVTNIVGVDGTAATFQGVTSGTITDAIGLRGIVSLASGSGATVTNGYGLQIQSAIDGSNTLTNNYGIFVDDQTEGGTADYGIAIAGADTYALWVGSGADNTDAANGITFGASGDTNIYRSAADTLRTDDGLEVIVDAQAAFRVSDGVSGNLVRVDTTDGDVFLGNTSLAADLYLADGDGEYIRVQAGAQNTDSLIISLPDNVGQNDTFCLQTEDNCGAASVTLQDAYDNGNNITTTDARDIEFDLADTTTDADFIVDILGTGNQFIVADGGTTVLEVADGTNRVDITNTLRVGFDGSNYTDFASASDGDLSVSATGDVITFNGDGNNTFDIQALFNGDGSGVGGAIFRTSETNAETILQVQPNGSGVGSQIQFCEGTGACANDYGAFGTDASSVYVYSNDGGSGEGDDIVLRVDVGNEDLDLLKVGFSNTNLVANGYGGFENGTTGWAAKGAGSIAQNGTYQWEGDNSMAVTTTAAADDGAEYAYTWTASTQYTVSFYARLASGSMTTLDVGFNDNGDNDECTGNTLSSSGWTYFSCTFTTGGTIGGSPTLYINQSDATARTFYIDGVQLEQGASAGPFENGTISLNGVIDSPLSLKNQEDSRQALVVKNTSDQRTFSVDTLNNETYAARLQIGGTDQANACQNILGQSACDSSLEIFNVSTETTDTTVGIYNYNWLTPSAENTATNFADYNVLLLGSAEDYSGVNYGIYSQAASAGAGTIDELVGVLGYTTTTAGTVTEGIGLQSQVSQGTAGSFTTAIGVNVESNTGTITNNYGILVEDQTAGSTADYGIAIAGADTYALWVGSGADNTDAANGITFGASGDTNLYRSAADYLRTDDNLQVYNQVLRLDSNSDNNATFTVDSGSTTAQNSTISLTDQGVTQWNLRKDTSNDFVINDAQNSVSRIELQNGGHTTLRTGDDSSTFYFENASSDTLALINSAGSITSNGTTINLDNDTDTTTSVYLNSGATGAQISQIVFEDQDTGEWNIQKNSQNDFAIIDATTAVGRIYLEEGGQTSLRVGTDTDNFFFTNASSEEILTVTYDGDLIFEGDNADGFETTLEVVEPTADVTYQLAAASAGTYEICTTASVCTGYGASAPTLQVAYDNGNNITTTDARDIEFDLADTTTDADFIVDILGTGNTFEVRDGGSAVLSVVDGGATTLTNADGSDVALTVNGGTSTGNILDIQDNGSSVLTVADGGNATLTGNLLPGTDNTFDLGSSTARWQDLFVETSIDLGDDGDSGTITYDTTNDKFVVDQDVEIDAQLQVGDGGDSLSQVISVAGAITGYATIDNYHSSTQTSERSYGSYDHLLINPGGANSAANYADYNVIRLNSANDFTGINAGVFGYGYNASTGTVDDLYGVNATAQTNNAGATTTDLVGVNTQVLGTSGTTTNGYGLRVETAGGTIGTNYGILVEDQTAGTSDYGLAIEGADTYALWVGSGADNTDAANGITFGSSGDTNLYRSGTNTLRTNDNFTLDNDADSAITLTLDSGSTATQTSAIDFSDQGDVKWILTKSSTNNFAVSDQDNSINRIFLTQGGATEFRTGDDSSAFSFLNGSSEDLVTILSDGNLQFEGDTPDGFETTLQVVDPTADITYRLADASAGTYDICTTASVCTGYAASTIDLQGAYDNGNNITTADATDIEFDLADTATDADFVVDLLGTGNTLEVRDAGTAVFTVADGGATTIRATDGGSAVALTVNNGTSTGNVLNVQDNGTNVLSVADGGAATFQNSVDSTAAFDVQNSDGTSLVVVDTSTDPNLLSNGGFENGTTGWAAMGAGSVAQDSTYQWEGNDSLAVTTTAAADDGAEYAYTWTASTQYTVSFYARLASGSMTTLDIGFNDNGVNDSCTGNTLSNSGWTYFTCTFTTGGTIGGSPTLYINQSDATARTFYIDGVQLEQAATTGPFQNGLISLNGVIDSPVLIQNQEDSTEALVVKDTSDNNLIQVDTLNGGVEFDQKLQVGSSTGTVNQCVSILGLYTCDVALEAYESSTTTTGLNIIGTSSISQLSPSGASSAAVYGVSALAIAGDGDADNLTGNIAAFQGSTYVNTNGNTTVAKGADFGVNNVGTGTVTDLIGLEAGILQGGAGTITTGTGINVASPNITAGTLTTYRGININNGAGATNYGILIDDQTGGSSNDYGLAIEGADTYALWVGSGADNTDEANGITFGLSADVSIFRGAANTLETRSNFHLDNDADTSVGLTLDAGATTAQTAAVSFQDQGTTEWQIFKNQSNDFVVYDSTISTSRIYFADSGDNSFRTGDDAAGQYFFRNQSGDDLVTFEADGRITLEGATEDDYQTVLQAVDPTADITYQLEDASAGTYQICTTASVCTGYASSTSDLQDAYDNGNTITTTDARDIDITLDDTATDSNFTIDIATGSTGRFAVQDNGTDVLAVTSGGTTLTSADAADNVLTVTGAASQTGNLIQVQNSDDEDLLVVGDNGALEQSINTDPEGLGYLEDTNLFGAPYFSGARRVEVVGDVAFVTASVADTLTAFDVSDPTSPTVIGEIRDQDSGSYEFDGATGLAVRGQYAYVTGMQEDSLVIIDISDPGNMTYVGDITDGAANVELEEAFYVSVVGNYAYVASKVDDSISIIDVSDPTNPVGVGFICDNDGACGGSATTLENPEAVDVVGNYAYATSLDDNGVSVIDISDPTNPTEVGSVDDGTISTLTSVTDIEIDGNYAYVSSANDDAVTILDITDPSSITSPGSVTDATELDTAQGITLAGKYAYVAAYNNDSIAVVDISDVTSPSIVGTIQASDSNVELEGIWHTNVYDNKLFSASYGNIGGDGAALSIIDLGGATFTAANIGSLKVNEIEVTGELKVLQNLDVASGLTVGSGGIYSLGSISNYIAETSTAAGTVQGMKTTVRDTGIVTTGTDTTIGSVIDVTRTGATGGTINTTGLDIDVVGDTGGTSTVVGLDVNVSGADNNYAAIFQGGNVGIGIAAPTESLHISGGDLLLDRASSTDGLAREVTIGGAISSGTSTPYGRINFQNYDGGADYIGAQIWAVNQGGDRAGAFEFYTSNTGTLNTNPALYLENSNRATFNGRILVENPDDISNSLLEVDGEGDVGSGSGFIRFVNDATGSFIINGNGNTTTSGNITAEGGDITIGSSSQAGDLILHDGDGETGTLRVASLGSDEVYILPDSDGSDTICLLDLGNCVGAGTNATLQAAYDAGNTIATTDARDIEFDLADTTTDADFIVDILGTGNTFEVRDGGTAVLRVADGGSIDLGSTTTGVNITSSGVLSDIDGNLVLGDTVDLGSASTGLNVTTAGVLSDIDGDLAVNDNLVVTGNILPSAASTYDIGSTSAEIQSLFLADNTGINLGLGQDVLIAYDEATDDRLEISGTNANVWIEDDLTVAGHAAIGADATVDSTTNSALFNCLFSVCDTAGESHTAALLVEEEFTDLNASNDNINVGIQSVVKLTPDADAASDHGFGIAATIDVDSSNTENIFSVVGSQAYSRLQGSGDATFHFANSFDAQNNATSGTTAVGAGAYGAYSISGGGDVTSGYGVFGSIGSSATGTGDYTLASALRGRVLLNASSTTNVTDAYGAELSVTNGGSGTITDAFGVGVTELEGATNNYGVHVANLSSATTNYGLYVDHAASGTDYGLYVDDAETASINLASTDNDVASGITFGGDVTLYRNAANVLRTDDSLDVANEIWVSDGTDATDPSYTFLNDQDTGLYLHGTNELGITAGGTKIVDLSSTGISFGEGADRTLDVDQRASDAAGRSLTVAAGQGGAGSGQAGGALNLQGGAAGGTNANGGNVVLSGGAGAGTGVNGLVVISNPTVSAAGTQNCTGTPCTITQANIDTYGSIAITTDATGYTVELSDPTITTAGRLIYITNADATDDFTLSANAGAETITLKPGTTATMIWGGADWTAAGASSSTDLQAAYDNTAASAGAAELVLNAPGGNADGLTIRNNETTPIEGALLEVQASIGNNLFSVNNFGTEYAANGGGEDSSSFSTDWVDEASATTSRDTTSGDYATGLASVQVVTTANAADGVENDLATNLATSTTYQVSFTGQLDSGAALTTLEVAYSPDGGTTETVECSNYSSQTLVTTNWTKITCDLATDGTAVTDSRLIIRQDEASVRNFNIDNLSIRENSASSTPPNVQIGGGENGGAVTLFTLDQASSPPVASGDSTYYGSMYYDTVTGRIQCYEADGWGACGSPPNNIITITPEYAGAVLNGSGVGTMSADFCSDETGILEINATLCDSGEAVNYYEWTSPQATAQTYSILLTFQLPTTFDGFIDNDTITLDARTTNTGNSDVDYEVFRSTGSAITECGSNTTVTTSDDTWQTVSHNGDEADSCSFAAGDRVIFKINMVAQDNDSVYVSDINFTYTNE